MGEGSEGSWDVCVAMMNGGRKGGREGKMYEK